MVVFAHDGLGSGVVDLEFFCSLPYDPGTSLIPEPSQKTILNKNIRNLGDILLYLFLRFFVFAYLKNGISLSSHKLNKTKI